MIDVVLIGPAGAGKDSVFKELEKIDPAYKRYAFADGVKEFLERQFDEEEGIDWDDAKQDPFVRELLQSTGMAGRAVFENIWIEVLLDRLNHSYEIGDRCVFTDARMENELAYLLNEHDSAVLLVHLTRPEVEDADDEWREHPSELDWRSQVEYADISFTDDQWTPSSAAIEIHKAVTLMENTW